MLACLCNEGLLLAADRRIAVGHGAQAQIHSLQKLFPLGPCAAVATSGAAVGVYVSRTLSRLLGRRGALPTGDLAAYALSVFQGEYSEFQDQGAAWFASHPEAHRLSYVLLGGRDLDGSYSFAFYASEAHREPYRRLPTGDLLTVPRRLGLEARLGRARAGGASLTGIRDVALEGLRLVASKEEAVAGPFDAAMIDAGGVRIETVEA